MASIISISQFQPPLKKDELAWLKQPQAYFVSLPTSLKKSRMSVVVSATTAAEKPKKRYPGEGKGFVEEMRFVAMKLHTRDQAKEGEKEPQGQPLAKWEPSLEGYLKFLVDSKLVYDTLERIVDRAAFPEYAEFRNTGLERSESLAKDLEWFKQQGNALPEPSSPGISYHHYLEELSEKDPQSFICHFYNAYFAHTAGGRMIGRKNIKRVPDSYIKKRWTKNAKVASTSLPQYRSIDDDPKIATGRRYKELSYLFNILAARTAETEV
ncbi:Heme oxygenase 1 [Orobanche hederae]